MTEYEELQKKKEEEERELLAFINDVRDIASSPKGKKLFWYLLEITGMHSLRYEEDTSKFNIGRASVGQDIVGLMDSIDPTLYPTVLLEKARGVKDE